MIARKLAELEPLAELPLERVRAPQVEDLMAALADRRRGAPRWRSRSSSASCAAAEARGQTVDPRRLRRPRRPAEEREPRFLTWEEAEELRSWMPEFVCRIVPIAILTMLRRGEILALRDRDVDFGHGAITVVSPAHRADGARGRRRVPAAAPSTRPAARQAPPRAAARAGPERGRPPLPLRTGATARPATTS